MTKIYYATVTCSQYFRVSVTMLTDNIQLANRQHGIRKKFSTTSALHTIQDQVFRGLNQERPYSRSGMVAMDLSKAFDSIGIY